MGSWLITILLICGLLAGCGRNRMAQPEMTMPPPPPPETEQTATEQPEDSLAEQLSSKRMEELLAKSGLGFDPALEEELKKGDFKLKFDVPIDMNKQVRAYLVYFTTERKDTIKRYLSRSTRYLPMIREVFQEHGLPEDLAYLAMIESGYNPHAYSHAAACGLWQFIRGTGVRYGLTINNYIDERRDPEKSTHAAAKYLLDLYKRFGSWYLAAASYNCGEGRVQREINSGAGKNFWELSENQCLPGETKNYVPQMIAATIIAKNPEKFGFKNVPYLPPLKYDTVKVSEPTSLRAASVACNVPLEEMHFLNPELRKGVTPPEMGAYVLKIPKGASERFRKNIDVARIELPAHASSPVEASVGGGSRRSYARSSGSRSSGYSRKAAANSQAREKSSKAAAAKNGGGKKGPVQVASAKKGKGSDVSAKKGGNSPTLGGMIPGSGGSQKGAKKSTAKPTSQNQAKKEKVKAQKASPKKPSVTATAKKGKERPS
jgi:membrane-bound lytic murein transglycosylase D